MSSHTKKKKIPSTQDSDFFRSQVYFRNKPQHWAQNFIFDYRQVYRDSVLDSIYIKHQSPPPHKKRMEFRVQRYALNEQERSICSQKWSRKTKFVKLRDRPLIQPY